MLNDGKTNTVQYFQLYIYTRK